MNDNTTLSDSPSFESFDDDSTGYDPTTGTFHRQFDADSDTIIGAIVESVGAVTNCDPTTMTALYETIDPEALATLVRSNRDRPIEVSFSYEGCQVSVSNRGTVVVEPPER
ncbi:HalOD1 output domain-containing protein [Natronorubrum sp. FCH18a]|uniref:HalOD1 output domain-containing protein n=1 Tax=Natronorubrum sp. FCH18a TaxID=3447018 RepID=UPI003F51728F